MNQEFNTLPSMTDEELDFVSGGLYDCDSSRATVFVGAATAQLGVFPPNPAVVIGGLAVQAAGLVGMAYHCR
ncbi:hypothetical protein [Conchiformibius steedae]|uniref:Bacteriocin n=1 Tax=Conchiformibius steedae TaxID=153493 RepID=A0A3P2A680_9NEIS|nr:hypothetical protein [Conchiformibius steedae]RRD90914.1 hypothetical protein EII21_02885 [Conchiformibius steedae]